MESFRTEDGRTLAYRREGAGPALVCHPGGPGFSGRELGDLAGLSRHATLILLDPRGTGGSDPPSDPSAYTLEDYAADLEELRLHLGLERLGLLGFSHGGMVVLRYAIDRPAHTDRLVLAATLARFGEPQRAEYERFVAGRAGEPWYGGAMAALAAEERGDFETPEELERLSLAMAPMYFARWSEEARAFVEGATQIGNVEALKLFNAAPPDLTSELAGITAPTLVVAGEQDFVCGPAAARDLEQGIRGARLVLLPDCGHWVFYEQAERFRAAVASFLAERAVLA